MTYETTYEREFNKNTLRELVNSTSNKDIAFEANETIYRMNELGATKCKARGAAIVENNVLNLISFEVIAYYIDGYWSSIN